MDEILSELEKLGTQIETAKSEKSKEEGRLEEMNKTLKAEFEVDSLPEADKLMTKMEKELKVLDEEIEKDYTELRSNYHWE